MRLTTKGRYAVTAMLDLALNSTHGPVALADISKRQDISLSYLEQLFSKLRQKKLIRSIRGPGGGYLLACDSNTISIADIVDAVSESVDTTRCKEKGDCQNGEKCLTHHLWLDLSHQIHTFLSDITLHDLMKKRDVQVTALRQVQKSSKIESEIQHT